MGGLISTHALREEGDRKPGTLKSDYLPFLPTPSARRATLPRHPERFTGESISTHALREEGDVASAVPFAASGPISTHALREEGDCLPLIRPQQGGHFYPRPPRGGRQQIRRKPRPIYRQHDGSKSKIYKNFHKNRFLPGAVSPKIPLSPPKSGANPAGKPCPLPVRTVQILTTAGHHPATTAGTSPHVPPYSDSGSPAGKTAGYRSRGQ